MKKQTFRIGIARPGKSPIYANFEFDVDEDGQVINPDKSVFERFPDASDFGFMTSTHRTLDEHGTPYYQFE